jgi:hypothetical protein
MICTCRTCRNPFVAAVTSPAPLCPRCVRAFVMRYGEQLDQIIFRGDDFLRVVLNDNRFPARVSKL